MAEAQTKLRRGPAPGSTRGGTRGDILAKAEQVFADVGYTGSSLDMIAEVVGIRRPSVLHHFASKREIYDMVERDIFDTLAGRTQAVTKEGAPFDRLVALLGVWLDFMIERPAAARIIMRNTSDLIARAADPVIFSDSVIALFEAIIREGQASGDFRPVDPMMALNILGGGIMQYVCNAGQFGATRIYDFADARQRAEFHDLLVRTARALLLA